MCILSRTVLCLAFALSTNALVQLSVRLSSRAHLRIDGKPLLNNPQEACSVLKERSMHFWELKVFSNCTYVALRKLDIVPWYSLRIALDEKKLPSWYSNMSEFEQVWLINVMLNANTNECGTAVTKWKKNYVNGSDARAKFIVNTVKDNPYLFSPFSTSDYKLNEVTSVSTTFILVGPRYPSACTMLLRKRQFVDGNIVLKDCLIRETSKQRNAGLGRLARYQLTLLQTGPPHGRKPDYSLRFLNEINGNKCNFNGFWPRIRA